MFNKEMLDDDGLSLVPWDCYSDECIGFSRKVKFNTSKSNAEIIALILVYLNKISSKQNICFNFITKDLLDKFSNNSDLISFYLLHVNVFSQITWKEFIRLIKRELVDSKNVSLNKCIQESNISNISIVCSKVSKKTLEMLFVKCDILFIIRECGSIIEIKSKFNILEKKLVDKMLEGFCVIAQKLRLNITLGEIALLSGDDSKKLKHFNTTYKKLDSVKTIFEEIENVAKNYPERIAVVLDNTQLTYEILNKKSNQLAHYLVKYGVDLETPVAICLPIGFDLIITILAILKAGGVYVPIDPEYLSDRVEFILQDCCTPICITTSSVQDIQRNSGIITLFIDQIFEELMHENTDNLNIKVFAKNLCYIIYTSGSTGMPKGVGVSYEGLNNLVKFQIKRFGLFELSRTLFFASISFDASFSEWACALCASSTLVLCEKNIKDRMQIVKSQLITHITLPPSIQESVQEYFQNYVGTIVFAGEKLTADIIDRICKYSQISFLNAYGPTEASICSSCSDVNVQLGNIGHPISNTQIYILDNFLNQMPIDVIGEIHIGGLGLARGYLNNPKLTALKFIANPFCSNRSRLYKTGDLGRYLSDGNIEFIGRIDHQVKIRGFRIELGEIESLLQKNKDIYQAVVLAREDTPGHKKLVGYIVLTGEGIKKYENDITYEQALVHNLREEILKSLPSYMHLSQLMILTKLPLTINGKLDRKALPKPVGREGVGSYEAPRGTLEKKLANIWSELLNIKQIGRNDNFFSSGGDSIVCIQLVSKARMEGIIFEVKQIFDTPTIAGLAVNSGDKLFKKASQSSTTGEVKLLPIQDWFFKENFLGINHYNQAMWFIPRFNLKSSDKLKVQLALKLIYEHHDTLRLRYKKSSANSEVIQYYHEDNPYAWEEESIDVWDSNTLSEYTTKIHQSLDIINGPLSRTVFFESLDGKQGLFWVIHHLLVDGVSWRILLEDLNILLSNKKLPSKSYSYQAFTNSLSEYMDFDSTDIYYKSKSYQYTLLPKDNLYVSKPAITKQMTVTLNERYSMDFLYKAQSSYNTKANDLLLTALILSIGQLNGKYNLCLDLEGHGREGELDLTRTLGWFTIVYPVYLNINNPNDLGGCIKQVKEQLRKVPNKGFAYSLAVMQGKLPRIKGDILFNYLGQWDIGKGCNEFFKFGNESKGKVSGEQNLPSHNLTIDGGVESNKLIFTFNYTNKISTSTIVDISTNFQNNLVELIKYCSDPNNFGYTPSDFELLDISQEAIDKLCKDKSFQNVYPLSPMQTGLLFQSLYNPSSDTYFVQSVFKITNFNIKYFKQAWQIIINTYEALRASFVFENLDSPLQIIHHKVTPYWNEVDISSLEKQVQFSRLREQILQERNAGFDVKVAPLMRFNLLKINNTEYYFIWNHHHLLIDGWCGPKILNELTKVYILLSNDQDVNSNEIQGYKQYLLWLSNQNDLKAQDYWTKELCDVKPCKLSYKTLAERVAYAEESILFSLEESKGLSNLSNKVGVTLNTVLQAVWALVLRCQTQQKEVVFGVTVSGRNIDLSGIEDMIGVFINTLPLKIKIPASIKIIDLLKIIQSKMSSHQEYGYIPLASIQATQKEREFFDSIFIFENYPTIANDAEHKQNFCLKRIEDIEKTEYPMTVFIVPGDKIKIKLNYIKIYFDEQQIGYIKKNILQLCQLIVKNPNEVIGNLIATTEYDLIKISNFNKTSDRSALLKDILPEVFVSTAGRFLDSIAISYGDKQISYFELNKKVNQLSNYLIKQGVSVETPVAISTERSIDLVIGILAILKSGGVFVPLDPIYPLARLNKMLLDCGAKLLLTTQKCKEELNDTILVVPLDRDYSEESSDNPVVKLLPDNLCYIIYTSGSTGVPKGVGVRHVSFVNVLNSFRESTLFNNKDSLLSITTIGFDISLLELFMPLLSGGMLNISNTHSKIENISLVVNDIKKYNPSVLQAVPSFFIALEAEGVDLTSLRINRVLCGGEALTEIVSSYVLKISNMAWNVYGPVETTIWSISNKLKSDSLNIGHPIFNTQVYILDNDLNQVSIGIIGEIYIGGVGLARGYLNKPGLTSEKFIANPFKKGGIRLYKTGDLARWLPDGSIEYIGRDDFQVKIRGYRVELGEIESRLLEFNGITQVVVVDKEHKEGGGKYLVGYYVSEDVLNEKKIFKFLKDTLPNYMMPSVLVHLDKLPLTVNGKLDRKSLLDPKFTNKVNYIAPQNNLEEKICQIWSNVLGISADKIGIKDEFFRLGGNSILAIKLVSKLNQVLDSDVNILSIIEHDTIEQLSSYIERNRIYQQQNNFDEYEEIDV